MSIMYLSKENFACPEEQILHKELRLAFTVLKPNEPQHISNNVVCATSKDSDQPAHMRSLIRAFARRLNIL